MPHRELYHDLVYAVLKQMLPPNLFSNLLEGQNFELIQELEEQGRLPLIRWEEWGCNQFSVFLLCRTRAGASKFFFDMISRWLMPGKRLNISSFFSTDFSFYTLCEIAFGVTEEEREKIRYALPIFESEIQLGVISSYHASRILEIKGLSADEKTALIQEGIASLVRKRPRDFDYALFTQMQHFLVMCRDEFKGAREYRHMIRLITAFYQFNKILLKHIENAPPIRHVALKLFKTRLHVPLGVKRVLGLVVGINFLQENEIFEERHLLAALRHLIPSIESVEDSFLVHESRENHLHTVYLEIVKREETDFSLEEIRLLRTQLPIDLRNHVEHLLRPLFMPRNEEEIMRHIVTLSHELKYIRDLPQMVVSFDSQTHDELCFTVVLLRLLNEGSSSIQQLFAQTRDKMKTSIVFDLDRVKRVGFVRNRYPKEATVFRLRFLSAPFLRDDHSVDLYKARQAVIREINQAIGDVRDFNGGMIAKQIEVFLAFKNALGSLGDQQAFLVENFFHSLFPVETRSMIAIEPLKALFLMMLTSRSQEGSHPILFKKENDRFLVLLTLLDPQVKQRAIEAIAVLGLPSSQLVTLQFEKYLGYIYFCDEPDKQEAFLRPLALLFGDIMT